MKSEQRDFYLGLLFIVISLVFGVSSLVTLPLGTFASMGPGSFPLLLSSLLLLLGLTTFLKSLRTCRRNRKHKDSDIKNNVKSWRPLVCILAAVFLFGFLLKGIPAWKIPAFGFIAGIYAAIFVTSYANSQQHFRQTFVLATVLALGCYFIFIRLMGLVVPVWPVFIN